MRALRWGLIALGGLSWLVPWGGPWAALRAASGGVVAGGAGVALGWSLSLGAYSLGTTIQAVALRVFAVGLSLPLLLLSVVLWRQSAQGAVFFASVAAAAALRSGYLFLLEARLLEAEPFVEAARALGATRPRLFLRHTGPSLRGAALPLALELGGAALSFDLLLSALGGGSGQLRAAADEAARGQGGALLLAGALAALVGAALGREAARLRALDSLLRR